VAEASGFHETEFTSIFPDWRTNLCIVLGFRVDEGSKRFVRLIEIVTLAPVSTNAVGSVSIQCPGLLSTGRVCRLISQRYPIRIRVFDEQGLFLDESRRSVSWQFLTNGVAAGPLVIKAMPEFAALMDDPGTNNSSLRSPRLSASTNDAQVRQLLEGEGTYLRSIAALLALFNDTLAATSLAEARDHATAVALKPNWFKVLVNLGLRLNLEPDFDRATMLPSRDGLAGETSVAFPASLWQDKRRLVSAEFIAGSTKGAHFLTGGVRGIRAAHLTKPDHHLLIQVIAAGVIATNANLSTPIAP
jgi:hypothetical protein